MSSLLHMPVASFPVRATGRVARAYEAVDAQSRSGLGLVVMLYDGAIRFVGQALVAHHNGDRYARGQWISKTLAIVAELQRTLDVEAGARIGEELERLYDYMSRRLLDVTMKHDKSGLEECERLLSTLRGAWAQAAAAEAAAVPAPPLPAHAGGTRR